MCGEKFMRDKSIKIELPATSRGGLNNVLVSNSKMWNLLSQLAYNEIIDLVMLQTINRAKVDVTPMLVWLYRWCYNKKVDEIENKK